MEDRNRNIVFYDGDCLLCSKTITFLLAKDIKHQLLFSLLIGDTYSKIENTVALTQKNTVVLYKDNLFYVKSTAILQIMKVLPYPWKLLYGFILIPKIFRDFIYDIIAKNRYKWFGKTKFCFAGNGDQEKYFLP
jgi:predicted DCC family thiol-disulfide oxidoreductase YuxK